MDIPKGARASGLFCVCRVGLPRAEASLVASVSGFPLPAGTLGAQSSMGPEASWKAALFWIVGDIKKEGASRVGDPFNSLDRYRQLFNDPVRDTPSSSSWKTLVQTCSSSSAHRVS